MDRGHRQAQMERERERVSLAVFSLPLCLLLNALHSMCVCLDRSFPSLSSKAQYCYRNPVIGFVYGDDYDYNYDYDIMSNVCLHKSHCCQVVYYLQGPCNQKLYTLALKWSLYMYFEVDVYTIWVHGPLYTLNSKL